MAFTTLVRLITAFVTRPLRDHDRAYVAPRSVQGYWEFDTPKNVGKLKILWVNFETLRKEIEIDVVVSKIRDDSDQSL